MDQERVEKIISKVNGSMSIEGMPLTDNDKVRIASCLSGKENYDDAVRSLVEKHTVKSGSNHE